MYYIIFTNVFYLSFQVFNWSVEILDGNGTGYCLVIQILVNVMNGCP